MRAIPAAWIRGGTSKGLFFKKSHLPPCGVERDRLILAALGSPDPSGLQLNGVGGGISSTSKVVIISESEREGYDVDYLFGQVEIKERLVNWDGSCGNLSAGVGLFALAEGFVKPKAGSTEVRVWQVNQGYGMKVHVPAGVDAPLEETNVEPDLLNLAGIPGREPPVYVEILEPHVGKPLLPTGNVVDTLQLSDGRSVNATLVTAGNPTVFIPAAAAGLEGTELPGAMDYASLLPFIDELRSLAAPLLGIPLTDQPRVALVAPPQQYTSSAEELVTVQAMDLLARISTPGRIHHAFTGTGTIALACAAQVEGSVPYQCIPDGQRSPKIRIGHPGGVIEVRAEVQREVAGAAGAWHASGAGFDRTARYLMRGEVFIPHAARAP